MATSSRSRTISRMASSIRCEIETTDKTRFAAPRAERTGGETTVFERGTYTACDACKDDPSKPPLWQVRAKRIIHKNEERTVYYEDATHRVLGHSGRMVSLLLGA